MQDYKDLIVWKKAMRLAEQVLLHTQKFPKEQRYVLVTQMQRAAVSVPSNIAEGRTRHSENEFVYFLNIARGSMAELQTQIMLSMKMKFLEQSAGQEMLRDSEEIFKMIYGLRSTLVVPKIKAKTSRLKAQG